MCCWLSPGVSVGQRPQFIFSTPLIITCNSTCIKKHTPTTTTVLLKHYKYHNQAFYARNTPCLKTTVQNSFSQKFIKFPPTLTIFGATGGKENEIMWSALISRQRTAVLNALLHCYITRQQLVSYCSILHYRRAPCNLIILWHQSWWKSNEVLTKIILCTVFEIHWATSRFDLDFHWAFSLSQN